MWIQGWKFWMIILIGIIFVIWLIWGGKNHPFIGLKPLDPNFDLSKLDPHVLPQYNGLFGFTKEHQPSDQHFIEEEYNEEEYNKGTSKNIIRQENKRFPKDITPIPSSSDIIPDSKGTIGSKISNGTPVSKISDITPISSLSDMTPVSNVSVGKSVPHRSTVKRTYSSQELNRITDQYRSTDKSFEEHKFTNKDQPNKSRVSNKEQSIHKDNVRSQSIFNHPDLSLRKPDESTSSVSKINATPMIPKEIIEHARKHPRPLPDGKNGHRSKIEGICCKIMEEIYQRPFETIRPNFLRNPESGRNLEIDCYNDELKIGLEYNGPTHYMWPNHTNQTYEQFIAQIRRDRYKVEACDANGIYLITIPYNVPYDMIQSFIEYYLPENVEKRLNEARPKVVEVSYQL